MANTGFKGIDVVQTGTAILFRAFLLNASGSFVTNGTTNLLLNELQSDGSLKAYDWNSNTFKTTALTQETQAMTHQKTNAGATNTGIWTYALTTLTGFTVGAIYLYRVNNSASAPTDEWREFQYGGDQGDLVVTQGATGVGYLQDDLREWLGTAPLVLSSQLVQATVSGGVPTAAQVATAVWTDLLASSDFSTAASIGALLKADINAPIGSIPTNPYTGTPPTTSQIATAVWQDATAGDFTTANSIGKSLYTGVAPGANGGLFKSGNNVGPILVTNGVTFSNSTGAAFTCVGVGGIVADLFGNITGSLSGSVGSISGVTFPSNFGALGITVGGHISNVDTLTTYTGDTPQTGDSYTRIGAAGAGLTALGDTRIANLDATVSSRLAASSYVSPPSASTIAATVAAIQIDTTYTLADYIELIGAAVAGSDTGGPGSPQFKSLDGAKVVIAGSADASGNRSGITYTP